MKFQALVKIYAWIFAATCTITLLITWFYAYTNGYARITVNNYSESFLELIFIASGIISWAYTIFKECVCAHKTNA